MHTQVTLIALLVGAVALFRLGARGGTRNVLLVVCSFFYLFAYGPVVALLAGRDVYRGIVRDQVSTAAIGFALALCALVAADACAPQRRHFDPPPHRRDRAFILIPVFYVALIAYASLILLGNYSVLLVGNKLQQVAAAGSGHSIYLVLELCAVSLYFSARRSPLLTVLWCTNLIAYVGYSLLTSERDFLLVIVSVLVHRELLANRSRNVRMAGLGISATVLATFLFTLRSNQEFDPVGVLDQGSILFVDSFLMERFPSLHPYERGATYVDTVISVLPSWLVDTGTIPLNQWLVQAYASGSNSGYGFSLTGEAYMNFGLVGIPVVFFVLGMAHRYVVNRADRGDWWCYTSVYSTTVLMYALRGDSSQLLKSLLYGTGVFLVLHAAYVVRSTSPLDRSATPVQDEADAGVADRPRYRGAASPG